MNRATVIGDRPFAAPHGWTVTRLGPVHEPPPATFRGSAGAWGCWRAHQEAWALGAGFIFEDDALFADDFTVRATALLDEQFDLLLLGGKHLVRPMRGGRAVSVRHAIRSHAYVISPAAILALAAFMPTADFDAEWTGFLQGHGLTVLAADPWLVGQAAGFSTTHGVRVPQRWA